MPAPEPTPTHERIDVPGIGITTVAIWLAELIRANERARIAAKLLEWADSYNESHFSHEIATWRTIAFKLKTGTI